MSAFVEKSEKIKCCNIDYPVDEFNTCLKCGKNFKHIKKDLIFSNRIGGNNSGQVVQANYLSGDVTQITNNIELNSNEIKYIKSIVSEHSFGKWSFIAGIISLPGIFLGFFNFIGSFASIISILLPSTNIVFVTLFSKFIYALILCASVFGAAAIFLTLFILLIGERVPLPFLNVFLERQVNGKINMVKYLSKCSYGKCKGNIQVKGAPANENEVNYIGVCSENSEQHIYSFDKTELIGEPIVLTPKKKEPSRNS